MVRTSLKSKLTSSLVQRIEMMCQAVEAYIYAKKGVAIKINRIAIISDARQMEMLAYAYAYANGDR
jgi:hypothetical protein